MMNASAPEAAPLDSSSRAFEFFDFTSSAQCAGEGGGVKVQGVTLDTAPVVNFLRGRIQRGKVAVIGLPSAVALDRLEPPARSAALAALDEISRPMLPREIDDALREQFTRRERRAIVKRLRAYRLIAIVEEPNLACD
jgi:hypothetical protein